LFFLASTSAYRRALLERLQLPFECVAPASTSSAARETAEQMTPPRPAQGQPRATAARSVVIGSDQAPFAARVLGKPGGRTLPRSADAVLRAVPS
jgi:septum formation protein